MDQQTEAVQRMQDYIESHLDQEITLMTLSKVSLFSPWHSHRLFKERLASRRRSISAGCGFPTPPCV